LPGQSKDRLATLILRAEIISLNESATCASRCGGKRERSLPVILSPYGPMTAPAAGSLAAQPLDNFMIDFDLVGSACRKAL